MGVLAYTAIYQMTYLFLETVEGKLTNRTVNTSFEVFLHDVGEAIQENDWADLEPVRNSILEYYQATVENEAQLQHVLRKLEDTLCALNQPSPALIQLAEDVLKELL